MKLSLATKHSQEIHEIFCQDKKLLCMKKNCLLCEKFISMLSHFMTASIIVKRQQKSTIKKLN